MLDRPIPIPPGELQPKTPLEQKSPYWRTVELVESSSGSRDDENGESICNTERRIFNDGTQLYTEGRNGLERADLLIPLQSATSYLSDNGFDLSKLDQLLREKGKEIGNQLRIQFSEYPLNLFVNGVRVDTPSIFHSISEMVYFFDRYNRAERKMHPNPLEI